ncbi:Cyclin-dependent kinase inhibitor 3 [Sesamum angolense]|uniref:Cyclin-dependent kinase inhibitor 3 n=1 Tax=Sesamum angolense TaxID=2727404 RepID=A0AAE1X8T7_9LAMI|nr:Cyclin-dependent kinase inhibitor 3 [Sesamum angolense]
MKGYKMRFLRSIPTAHEMEEFFTRAEQPQQRHFIEKYNFDIVNDLPLPGRYEVLDSWPKHFIDEHSVDVLTLCVVIDCTYEDCVEPLLTGIIRVVFTVLFIQ